MGLECVTCGLPISAKEFLVKAMNEGVMENGVQLVELSGIQLRSRIRLASRNVSDVLVVLDAVSAQKCADIEDGLYSSDKYHEYSSDEDLVNFLNEKYDLSLEVKSSEGLELAVENGSAEQDMIIEKLREQVSDRDFQIVSLKAQISELQDQLEDEGSVDTPVDERVSELEKMAESLRQENLELRNNLSDTSIQLKEAEESESQIRSVVESISRESENLKTENNQLKADYRAVSSDLSDLRIKFSNAQGTLSAKDREIEELRKGKDSVEDAKRKVVEAEEKIKSIENEKQAISEELRNVKTVVSNFEIELKSKDEEIVRLSAEADSSEIEEALSKSKAEVVSLQKVIVDLKDKLFLAEEKISSVEAKGVSEADALIAENDALKNELEGMKSRTSMLDEQFMLLNEELIKAKSRAEMLEKSTSRDTDVEAMYSEMNEIRSQYVELSQSVFGKISEYSSPSSSTMIDLIKTGDTYNNIRFVFSGSTESRKGTYRSLLNEFNGISDSRVVIVDATCETCIDYVFEIKRVVKGLNWFIKGGGIMSYLSDTCLPNVKVLSPGLGYINDSYFLTVDWEKRLKELNESGYNVVVYCGDISSLVGRILHETFASRGSSMVYVHGNAIGARTVVTNLRGLSNSKDSVICYFEFNKKVEKFYNAVLKDGHECRVISMV